MEKKILIQLNRKDNKKIFVEAEKCSFFGKFFGLMFKRRKKAKALLFEFKNPRKIRLHSIFVFFPFLVIWLNDKNKVFEFKIARPFEINIPPGKKCRRVLEIPLNDIYKEIAGSFRRKF